MTDHKLAANVAHDAPRLVTQLQSTAFALVFAGQGVDWLGTLRQALAQGAAKTIEPIVAQANRQLEAVESDILGTRPFGFAPLSWAKATEATQADAAADGSAPAHAPANTSAAAVSVPGILVAQLAVLDILERQGLDIDQARTALGHSQGVLGVLALKDLSNAADVLAIAQLIGAAITRRAQVTGLCAHGDASPMIAIAGITREALQEAIEHACGDIDADIRPVIGLRNARDAFVLVGRPGDNERVVQLLQAQAARSKKEVESKQRGGSAFAPKFNPLPVDVGFHHPQMAEGVEDVVRWAGEAGLDEQLARTAAEAVMVTEVDWPTQVHEAVDAGASWLLDVGPAEGVVPLTRSVLQGTGAATLGVAGHAGQAKLFDAGQAPALPQHYAQFAPKLVRDAHGDVRVATKFTEITGRSPMLLAGMTPTTVDPAIVAAAANAGHWAELAGGGQVTPEILEGNLSKLAELLEPGVNAQFNSMFLDPYLWKMQIGGKRLVPKARSNGAPIDGIVITAGIPEHDEAVALVRELRADGFPWIAFKPGAVAQIRKVLAIAASVPEVPIIMHVEGGKAGGHHSWEDLDELLIATYADIRNTDNAILCVGGGIGTPERAADYLTGSWSKRYELPAMPVDGILIGTAAMACKEATTSEAVKQLLVETPGSAAWVPAGGASSGMASGRSQLGADIHEIDNSFARAGRLLDEVAGDAEAVEKRREEIIEAIGKTAKPYFGDLQAMTYEQWLRRYLELSGPYQGAWTDASWLKRFEQMVERAEARLHEVDHGEIEASISVDADAPEAAVDTLCAEYPQASAHTLHPADVVWFLSLARTPGKPVNFVPVIDKDVRRWWRSDSLWQSHDDRYSADQVAIIPGIEAVAGITEANEPVAHLLGRFVEATKDRLEGQEILNAEDEVAHRILQAPSVSWAGRMSVNPAHRLAAPEQWEWQDRSTATHPATGARLRALDEQRAELNVPLRPGTELKIVLSSAEAPGAYPLVTREDAEAAMDELCRVAAGGTLGHKHEDGEQVEITWETELTAADIADYRTVTEGHLGNAIAVDGVAADVLVGKAWPAIFAAVASARVPGDDTARVVEGMLNLVHLEHHITVLDRRILSPGAKIAVTARAEEVNDTTIGRIVVIRATLSVDGTVCAKLSERMAIRGRRGDAVARTNTSALPSVHDAPRSFRAHASVVAPHSMAAFAAVSGDHNPIHTSDTAASLAGLPGVIVHGMWTSAIAQLVASASYSDETVNTKAAEVKECTATMLAPVLPGQTIEFTVERSGIDDRPGHGEVREVTATVEGTLVLTATVVLAEPRTFYAFPGQGIQSQGMGMEARSRSAAARAVWDRADAHTREHLGFSVLHIVEENPTEVRVHGETFNHPKGVLFLTQFTQVAMATLGVAQVAEMREAGVLQEGAHFAGHSVGEYNALAAFAGVLSLESVLEIVYRRGLTMHRLVERDEHGNSNYGLAALRPHKMGLSAESVFDYVQTLSQQAGEFLEIVNFNLEGKQYAVAGTAKGLRALAADAEQRAPGARAFIQIPGIDVPFHSTHLLDGVDDFREHLSSLIPEDVDLDVLVGHYVPNLVARPFELSEEFVQSMLDVVDAPILQQVQQNFAEWKAEPTKLARTLLVELLAWQFASPVRWIETQDLLLRRTEEHGLGIERFVEVGVASAPTLANLMAQTQALPKHRHHHLEILNVERDSATVFATDEFQREVPEAQASEQNSQAPAEPQDQAAAQGEAAAQAVAAVTQPTEPAAAPASGGPRPDDLPFTPADATEMLIAQWTKVRPDQMTPSDSIEALVEGVSSRRNQLLLDLGVEFGLGAIDGAADAELKDLKQTVSKMAKGYSPFGPVLGDAISDALRRITGPTGKRPGYVSERVSGTWELGQGWVDHVTAALVLGAREGASLRGGDLATLQPAAPANAGELDQLIDAAVQAVAAQHGVSVSKPGGAASGGVVDSAALGAFAEQVTGDKGVLAATARTILDNLGLSEAGAHDFDTHDADAAVVELVSKELGSDWLRQVAPSFDANKAVLIDDRWASAREDLSRIAAGEELEVSFEGAGETVARHAEYLGLDWAAEQAREAATLHYADDVAVVTGASPNSIAAAVLAKLLAGGATVVATTSSLSHDRLEFYKDLYRESARGQAALWVVPANLSSFADLEELVSWIGSEQVATVNGASKVLKPALVPTLLFPFAAPRVSGTLLQAGAQSELQMRLLLWSVEKLIAGLATIGQHTHVGERLHVVLPGSPNRGRFGGDGAYGESKAALDALVTRWHAESTWKPYTSLVHVLIGWVRGTGLMGGNDPLVDAVEKAGVTTFSTEEMAAKLIEQVAPEIREQAAQQPVEVDVTGGLGTSDVNLVELAQQVRAEQEASADAEPADVRTIQALPNLPEVLSGNTPDFSGSVQQRLDQMVVIVGTGELGPWGSARTRFEAEMTGDLSAAGVAELAWTMGLIHWDVDPTPGWYDAEDQPVAEHEIYERFHDEVLARVGVRRYHDDFGMVDNLAPELTSVYLDRDLSFTVSDEQTARTFVESEPANTSASLNEDTGEWTVTRRAGSVVRVPRRMTMSRFVGGQIPEGFDASVYGIPADMVDNLDRVALWNLVCTVDAFLSSGFSPAELLATLHPARVSSTQGTGLGGMQSMRSLYIDGILAQPRQNDILQEALPNVMAAHVMQSYVGGYGQMIHPVAACATAAVSVEEGVDKIKLGKSDFVVAGGYDDLSIEGITGFGDMAATADSGELESKGIAARYFSRANDRRRAGFVESAGGGTVLLARGSVAADLGLPVLGVIGFAESFADGAHQSIPAPGLGALGAARGGEQSRLAQALREVGVSADDVKIVSKHDTSTNANDPNESDLHERIAASIGRSSGNPLYVISQKTLTGHAKGGAAAFQLVGLTQVLATGVLPANYSLDCVDPVLASHEHLVWLRKPLNLASQAPKAGLLTSLGFGHVSALVAVVHAGAFEEALRQERGEDALQAYRTRSASRARAGARRVLEGMHAAAPLYQRPKDRHLGDTSAAKQKQREAAILLDEQARLVDGVLRTGAEQ